MVRRTDAEPPADGPRDRVNGPVGGSRQPLRLVHPEPLARDLSLRGRPALAGEAGSRPLTSLREALESDRVLSPRAAAHGLRRPVDPDHQLRRAVTQSNVESAFGEAPTGLDSSDPRWMVAVETAGQLEGSLLTFERRRRILALAQRVGVRPFDANLIIAAVQDRARRGEPLSAAMSTVALTAAAAPRRRFALLSREALPYTATAVAAVLLHVVGAWIIVRLLMA